MSIIPLAAFTPSTERGSFANNKHKRPLSRLYGLKRLAPSIKEVLLEQRCAFQRPRKRLALCDKTNMQVAQRALPSWSYKWGGNGDGDTVVVVI